jgi:hypothetical protein
MHSHNHIEAVLPSLFNCTSYCKLGTWQGDLGSASMLLKMFLPRNLSNEDTEGTEGRPVGCV